MGLGFSHGQARWSYSGFNRFREKIAKAIDIELGDMDGFHHFSINDAFKGFGKAEGFTERWEKLLDKEIAELGPKRSWDTISDPLRHLLHHSDCDGVLTPEQCCEIAPNLRKIVASWSDEDYDKEMALELAKGMDSAAEKNENLQFC